MIYHFGDSEENTDWIKPQGSIAQLRDLLATEQALLAYLEDQPEPDESWVADAKDEIARLQKAIDEIEPKGDIVKGGAGSGNFGHQGRRGEVGGSAPEGSAGSGGSIETQAKRPISGSLGTSSSRESRRSKEYDSDPGYRSALEQIRTGSFTPNVANGISGGYHLMSAQRAHAMFADLGVPAATLDGILKRIPAQGEDQDGNPLYNTNYLARLASLIAQRPGTPGGRGSAAGAGLGSGGKGGKGGKGKGKSDDGKPKSGGGKGGGGKGEHRGDIGLSPLPGSQLAQQIWKDTGIRTVAVDGLLVSQQSTDSKWYVRNRDASLRGPVASSAEEAVNLYKRKPFAPHNKT